MVKVAPLLFVGLLAVSIPRDKIEAACFACQCLSIDGDGTTIGASQIFIVAGAAYCAINCKNIGRICLSTQKIPNTSTTIRVRPEKGVAFEFTCPASGRLGEGKILGSRPDKECLSTSAESNNSIVR